jgi:hypothetical protein
MEFAEIKKRFEDKNYLYRSLFIDEYDFKDDYKDYYYEFICNHVNKVKRANYLSDLIDLANRFDFFDAKMSEKIDNLLMEKQALVVQLSIIAYLEERYLHLNDYDGYVQTFTSFLSKRLSRLLRNDILLSLLEFAPEGKEQHFSALIKSLKLTKDWRSVYKTLNGLDKRDIDDFYVKKIINVVTELHLRNDFGKGVDNLLASLATTSFIAKD